MLLHKDKADFMELCIRVVESLGKESEIVVLGIESKGKIYEDEVVYLARTEDGSQMEVQRKLNSHSVIYVKNSNVIYFHGEFIFLHDHLMDIENNAPK